MSGYADDAELGVSTTTSAVIGEAPRSGRSPVIRIPPIKVGMSTAAVYPEGTAEAFALAAELGYDGVEVMVQTEALSQDADQLAGLIREFGIPVLSVHSPCLLVTARVWSTDPLVKLARSVDMAERLGADTVVVHPPFVWQRAAAAIFAPSIAELQERTSVRIAVENMFPVKVRGAIVNSYRPHWNPVSAGSPLVHARSFAHRHVRDGRSRTGRDDGRPARASSPCRRVRLDQGRTPGTGPRRPALRRNSGNAGAQRLWRFSGCRDFHQRS